MDGRLSLPVVEFAGGMTMVPGGGVVCHRVFGKVMTAGVEVGSGT
jgi:hypothetical protein